PQANRYLYANASPLIGLDLTGHSIVKAVTTLVKNVVTTVKKAVTTAKEAVIERGAIKKAITNITEQVEKAIKETVPAIQSIKEARAIEQVQPIELPPPGQMTSEIAAQFLFGVSYSVLLSVGGISERARAVLDFVFCYNDNDLDDCESAATFLNNIFNPGETYTFLDLVKDLTGLVRLRGLHGRRHVELRIPHRRIHPIRQTLYINGSTPRTWVDAS
ncbi:MAG: hypothetical protein IRY92_05090, partial [Dactylosporangium sp.]|nr:hypothetical protein [Dactylosporangium sp.]